MRIVFVNSMRTMGGGERWLLEAAHGLRERGHGVSVVARTGSELSEAARDDDIAVLTLPMSGDLDPRSILRLAGVLRRERPDVLNVNVQRAVRIGCAAARLAGTEGLAERRGLDFAPRPTAMNRWVYGRCLALVIANCRAIKRQLEWSGLVPSERVAVVRNGIDPSRVARGGGAALRSELGIPGGAPVVAMVARLVRDKGHPYAFEGFARIAGRRPDARLIIAGDGKLAGELRRLASSVAPGGTILFLGRRDDVPAVLDAADVLLVSSLREGMPHSILEAMVAGTPVVATAVAGIPEMIADGREGVLISPGSADEVERGLARLLDDHDLAESMAGAAARRVRSEFSLDGMIDEVERCFEGVADRSGAGEAARGVGRVGD